MEGKTREQCEAEIARLTAALDSTPLHLLRAWEMTYSEVVTHLLDERERKKILRQSIARLRSRARRMSR
jgi:hypothetical protein